MQIGNNKIHDRLSGYIFVDRRINFRKIEVHKNLFTCLKSCIVRHPENMFPWECSFLQNPKLESKRRIGGIITKSLKRFSSLASYSQLAAAASIGYVWANRSPKAVLFDAFCVQISDFGWSTTFVSASSASLKSNWRWVGNRLKSARTVFSVWLLFFNRMKATH